jgi:hypothetical protein
MEQREKHSRGTLSGGVVTRTLAVEMKAKQFGIDRVLVATLSSKPSPRSYYSAIRWAADRVKESWKPCDAKWIMVRTRCCSPRN